MPLSGKVHALSRVMDAAPQTLTRQRIRELRKRQTAFDSRLNYIVHQFSAPGSPSTDPTPGLWLALIGLASG